MAPSWPVAGARLRQGFTKKRALSDRNHRSTSKNALPLLCDHTIWSWV